MTRINCIPVEELTDEHLGAEYRELPRVFALARRAAMRGEARDDPRNPQHYTLGEGHVRFFYGRLGYLKIRFQHIVAECRRRGRRVNFAEPIVHSIPETWFQLWTPRPEDVSLNRQRIALRLKESFSQRRKAHTKELQNG